MPMVWIPSEEFLRHGDHVVYYTCKYNDASCGAREYWYSLSEDDSDEDAIFNVRVLPGYEENPHDHEEVIKTALDSGYFKDWYVGEYRYDDLLEKREVARELGCDQTKVCPLCQRPVAE